MNRISKSRAVCFQASLAFLALTGATLAGCGMTKNLDEMHSSTSEMATTTKSMDQKMDQLTQMNTTMVTMSDHMDKMLTSMDHMAQGMDSMQTTMTSMATLMGQMTQMNQSMLQMKDDMGTMIGTLTGMNKTMSVMPTMSQSLGHMDGVMDQLNKMMVSLDKKMDTLPKINNTMNGMSGQIGGLSKQMTGLRSDLGTLNKMYTSLTTMQKGMESLDSKMTHVDTMATTGLVNAQHGGAATIRQQHLAEMEAAATLPGKFVPAASFIVAYDYQFVLQGTEEPVEADEETFRKDAVDNFFFLANNYTDSSKTINVVNPDSGVMNLTALAGALDYVDSNTIKHLISLKRNPNDFLSMWGMIKKALDDKADINGGKAVPQWEKEVLVNEEEAVYLSQLRVNIMAAIAMQNLSTLPKNASGFIDRVKQYSITLWDALPGTSWTANVDGANVAQITDTYNTLEKAQDAKSFLLSHGYETRLIGTTAGVAMMGALGRCEIPMGAADSTPAREAALAKLKDALAAFTR